MEKATRTSNTPAFDTIPTVDLNEFFSGDTRLRNKFVREIGDSFSNIGFAIVSNHGLSDQLRDDLYKAVKEFFALPDEVKSKYDIPGLAGQRGYTGKMKEHAKGRNTGDLKEFYHIGQTVPDGHPLKQEYIDNVFPDEVASFRETTLATYAKLQEIGTQLLRAIALYLNLPEEYFTEQVRYGNSILRPIHYYPIEDPDSLPADAVRSAEHEDINLITLLMGASAEGLEALNSDGIWVKAAPTPNQLVINVGDMLQRLTNGRLKSTTHRVVNPPRERMHEPRYSIPFFLHPVSSMDLTCLESCIDTDHPKRFSNMTAGEYLDERLREIGLKK